MTDPLTNSLRRDPTRSTLARLHAAARRERFKFLTLAQRFIAVKLQGKSFSQIVTPAAMKGFAIAIRSSPVDLDDVQGLVRIGAKS